MSSTYRAIVVAVIGVLVGTACAGGSTARVQAVPASAPITPNAPTKPLSPARPPSERPASRPSSTPIATHEVPARLLLALIEFCGTIVQGPAPVAEGDAGRQAWSVGIDPRHLLVVDVTASIGPSPRLFGLGEQAFMIHSPTKTFMGDEPALGNKRCFHLHTEGTVDHSELVFLEVIPPTPTTSTIAATCRGSALDLAKLGVDPACEIHHDAEPLPTAVTVAISPSPVVVVAGKEAAAAIVLTNTSAVEVSLFIDDGCALATKVSAELHDAHDQRVDLRGSTCGEGRVCGRRTLGIALVAGGTLRLPFVLDGRMEQVDETCASSRAGKVPRGRYDLVVESIFGVLRAKAKVR